MEANPLDGIAVNSLRRRGTKKWSTFGDEVLPAWIAEMDFDLATPIQETLIAAVRRTETGYISAAVMRQLAHACSSWLQRSCGFKPDEEQIQVIPDVLRGIDLAIRVFSRPNSPVVLITPAYSSYFDVVAGTNRQVFEVPLCHSGDRYTLDLEAIDAALRRGASTVILCNPHNPVGRVFTCAELVGLSEVVERNRSRVISDEIHAPIIYEPRSHVSYSTVSEASAAHSVTLISAAKGWNIGGLKCAQMILSNMSDLNAWKRLPPTIARGASLLGILANQAAYERGGPWLSDVVTYLERSRRYLGELLDRYLPMVEYRVPEATYLAWLDCRAIGTNPAETFLTKSRVALNDGASFGAASSGYVRLNFATSHSILHQIVERMALVVTE